MDTLFIGSHVRLESPNYFLGSVLEAISYGANTFMLYTGAPQNSIRKATTALKIEEGLAALKQFGIDSKKIVVHAPYIVNLGNSVNHELFDQSILFLRQEVQRVAAFGLGILVLHPGSHVQAGSEIGLKQVVLGLNEVLRGDNTNVKIALETMAGKGSEVGATFEEIRFLLDHVEQKERFGVCLDTCHISDAGYDITDVEHVVEEFDRIIGLDRLLCMHINDSKNIRGAHKDRHENIGYGEIGFEVINRYVHHRKLIGIPMILETPYVGEFPPYKKEILMLRSGIFIPGWREKL